MQLIHAISTAILMATLTLVGAVANTNDTSIPSTLTITEGPVFSTTSGATSSISLTISMTPNANPTPTPDPIANASKSCTPCYCEGETWDQLGYWQLLKDALMNSGVVRVTFVPEGYHVSYPYFSTCRRKS